MASKDPITKLAKIFKERDNPFTFSISTAKVISKNPIVLKIQDKVFLSAEYGNLKMSKYLSDQFPSSEIKVGDEIIVVPNSSGSIWYAIDKVVSV